MVKLYGIPNCNTVKKALDFLKDKEIEVDFHNYKKSGISNPKLDEWKDSLGWDRIVNKKGTTFRKLTDEQKTALEIPETGKEILVDFPSIIKRPIIEYEGKIYAGYSEEQYAEIFK